MVTTFCRFEPRLRGFPSRMDAENPAAGCQGFTGRSRSPVRRLVRTSLTPATGFSVLDCLGLDAVSRFGYLTLTQGMPKWITNRDHFPKVFSEEVPLHLITHTQRNWLKLSATFLEMLSVFWLHFFFHCNYAIDEFCDFLHVFAVAIVK